MATTPRRTPVVVHHEAVGDEGRLHELADARDGLLDREPGREDGLHGLHEAADRVGGVGEVPRPLPPLLGRGRGDDRAAPLVPERGEHVVGDRRVHGAQRGRELRVGEGGEERGRLGRRQPRRSAAMSFRSMDPRSGWGAGRE